jgi:hypothetical protein
MLVIHGTSLYGKVDQVKGLFHVATLFFHINWVPVIPQKSYLIFEGKAAKRAPQGVPIGLNGKSILFAWGRFLLLIGGCLALPFGCMVAALEARGTEATTLALIAATVLIVSIACLALSYRLCHARPERALELARLAGIEPARLAEFFAERMTPEEEDRLRNLVAEQMDSTSNSP